MYEIKDDIDLNILVSKYGFKEYKYYYKRKTNGMWVKVFKDSRLVHNGQLSLVGIMDLWEDNLLEVIIWVPLMR